MLKTQGKQKCDDQKVLCDVIFSPALIPMIPKPRLSLESTDLLAKLRESRAVKHRSFFLNVFSKKGGPVLHKLPVSPCGGLQGIASMALHGPLNIIPSWWE